MLNLGVAWQRFRWRQIPTLMLGLLCGSFWLVFGFLSILESPENWRRYVSVMAPGAAVLWLVLLARRHPVPFGSGLLALGLLPWFFGSMPVSAPLKAAFSAPLLVAGAGFIFWRETFTETSAHPRSES